MAECIKETKAKNEHYKELSDTNTHEHCRVNGKDHQVQTIETGVTQGSFLRSLLLLVYIYNLPKAINNCSVNIFPDDTSLSVHGKPYTS